MMRIHTFENRVIGKAMNDQVFKRLVFKRNKGLEFRQHWPCDMPVEYKCPAVGKEPLDLGRQRPEKPLIKMGGQHQGGIGRKIDIAQVVMIDLCDVGRMITHIGQIIPGPLDRIDKQAKSHGCFLQEKRVKSRPRRKCRGREDHQSFDTLLKS